MTSLGEVELSKTEPDRPVYPPKLISIQILDNPFDDIVPRITREEKKAQQKAKREAMESREKDRERKRTKKNTGLLSFGEAEETEGGDEFKGKGKSSHDLLEDKRLKKESSASIATLEVPIKEDQRGGERKKEKGREKEEKKSKISTSEDTTSDLSSLRSKHLKSIKSESATQIAMLEDSIRGISKKPFTSIEESKEATKKINKGRELLEQARSHYSSSKSGGSSKGKSADSDAVKALERFQKSLREDKGKEAEGSSSKSRKRAEVEDEEIPPEDREYGAGDSDDDGDWRSHRLVE